METGAMWKWLDASLESTVFKWTTRGLVITQNKLHSNITRPAAVLKSYSQLSNLINPNPAPSAKVLALS